MTRQLTTRTAAEHALLAKFRDLTPQGQKALQAWADFLRHLFDAPGSPARRTRNRATRSQGRP